VGAVSGVFLWTEVAVGGMEVEVGVVVMTGVAVAAYEVLVGGNPFVPGGERVATPFTGDGGVSAPADEISQAVTMIKISNKKLNMGNNSNILREYLIIYILLK
jgi:hypothetical protein